MNPIHNTLLLELPAATLEKLTAAAKAAGLTVEAYAASLLHLAAKKNH